MVRGTHLNSIVAVVMALHVVACDNRNAGRPTPSPASQTTHFGSGTFLIRSDASVMVTDNNVANDMLERNLKIIEYDIKGRATIEQLIRDLSWDAGIPVDEDGKHTLKGEKTFEDLIVQLRKDLKIEFVIDTPSVKMIRVSYEHADPAKVAPVVNRVMDNYLKRLRKELTDELLVTKKFFEAERNRYDTLVKELHVHQLKFSVLLADVPELPGAFDEPVILHSKLNELKRNRDRKKSEADELKEKVISLRAWEIEQPEFLKQRKPIKENGVEVRTEIEEVPNVQKIEAQKMIQESAAIYTATIYEYERIEERVQGYEVIVKRFYEIRSEYKKMSEDIRYGTESYDFWDAKLRDTQVALTMEAGGRGTQFSVFERCPDLTSNLMPNVAPNVTP